MNLLAAQEREKRIRIHRLETENQRLQREHRGGEQQCRAGRGEDACDQRAILSWAKFRTKPST